MLINLHAHQLTAGMFEQHEHWGPYWEGGSLRIGDWHLGSKVPQGGDAGSEARHDLDRWLAERWAPEPRLAAMDAAGIDIMVMSLPAHMSMYWAEPDFGIRYARTVNEELAEFRSANPERLHFWASLPAQAPDAAAKELDYAVTELGAQGAYMGGANFGGLQFDSPELYALWEKVCELGVPIFVHGYNQSVTWGKKANDDPYDTTSIVGMLYDETTCFWNLICGGVLDRFPDMQVYITHAGGYVPYHLGRFAETNETMASDSKNQKPVMEYVRNNFWFDPLTHSAAMRRAITEVIGVDRLLYGDNFGGADRIDFDLTGDIGLSDADREKIRSGNAKKLLNLGPDHVSGLL